MDGCKETSAVQRGSAGISIKRTKKTGKRRSCSSTGYGKRKVRKNEVRSMIGQLERFGVV